MESHGREHLVAHHDARLVERQGKAGLGGVGEQRRPEKQEQHVHHHQQQAHRQHILLCVAQRLAGQVLLHHILVQSRHGDGDEHAAQYLLPVVFGGCGVGLEDPCESAVGRAADELWQRVARFVEQGHEGGDGGGQQEGGLQRVGPHHCLYPPAEGVEQDDGDEHRGGHPKRYAPPPEHKLIQHEHHEIHPQRRAQESRQQEEQRPRLFGSRAEPLPEVGIDGGEVQPIVERQQEEGDDRIANQIAENQRQVGELSRIDPARHRHESHARQGSSNHAVGHHRPGRPPLAAEKGVVAGTPPRRQPHHHEQQQRIG